MKQTSVLVEGGWGVGGGIQLFFVDNIVFVEEAYVTGRELCIFIYFFLFLFFLLSSLTGVGLFDCVPLVTYNVLSWVTTRLVSLSYLISFQ